MRKYAAEFIGTFVLTLTICCTVLTGSPLAPLAIGGALIAMVFAGGHVSGAHFNPAVSVAVLVRGKMAASDFIPYVVAQIAGAVVAAGAARFITNVAPKAALTASGRQLAAAGLAELLLTFALTYVVLNVATSKDHPNNSFYGIAIGLTVMAGAIGVGGISGGVFNPAVGVGVSVAGLVSWSLLPMYVAVQCVAGALAAVTFKALNPHENELDDEAGTSDDVAGSVPVPRAAADKSIQSPAAAKH